MLRGAESHLRAAQAYPNSLEKQTHKYRVANESRQWQPRILVRIKRLLEEQQHALQEIYRKLRN